MKHSLEQEDHGASSKRAREELVSRKKVHFSTVPTLREFENFQHLFGPKFECDVIDAIDLLIQNVNSFLSWNRNGTTIRMEIEQLLRRSRKPKEAKAIVGNPREALLIMRKEAPCWWMDFESKLRFWQAYHMAMDLKEIITPFGALKDIAHFESRDVAKIAFTGTAKRGVNYALIEVKDHFLDQLSKSRGDVAFMAPGFGRLLVAVAAAEAAALKINPDMGKIQTLKIPRRPGELCSQTIIRRKRRKFKISIDPRQESVGIFKVDLSMKEGNLQIHVKETLVGIVFHTSGDGVFRTGYDYLVEFLAKLSDDQDGAFLDHVFKNVCRCVFCGRGIVTENSQAQGAGDICHSRYGGAWKKAAFTPPKSLQTTIRLNTQASVHSVEAALPAVLVKASPLLTMMLEGEDEESTASVLDVVGNEFSPNDIARLSEFISRFCVVQLGSDAEARHGTRYALHADWWAGDDVLIPFKLDPNDDIDQALERRNALIGAVLETGTVGPVNYQERVAFIWMHMLHEGMVRLVHYLGIELVMVMLKDFFVQYHVESLWEKYVDCTGRPRPFKPDMPGAIERGSDPDAPKKPRTAYQYYVEAHKEEVKKLLKESGIWWPKPSDVRRRLGTDWKALSKEDKAAYISLANEDKARYATEMQAYTPPAGMTKAVVQSTTETSKASEKSEKSEKSEPAEEHLDKSS